MTATAMGLDLEQHPGRSTLNADAVSRAVPAVVYIYGSHPASKFPTMLPPGALAI